MSKCYICQKKAVIKYDGNYVCHKHYQQAVDDVFNQAVEKVQNE